jgi:hypothetical protein
MIKKKKQPMKGVKAVIDKLDAQQASYQFWLDDLCDVKCTPKMLSECSADRA